jgi:hypothetical protein
MTPLEVCMILWSSRMADSVVSFKRATIIGTLISISENLEESYLWQTLEINSPIEDADTAIKLYSIFLGCMLILREI